VKHVDLFENGKKFPADMIETVAHIDMVRIACIMKIII
jgi:hypothetical protein